MTTSNNKINNKGTGTSGRSKNNNNKYKTTTIKTTTTAFSCEFVQFMFTSVFNCRCPSNQGKMTYEEFVWFLMAEEDKRHPRR